MAKPRRQYTLNPDVLSMVESYAERYTGGNHSKAVEALLKQGIEAQRSLVKKGLAYGAVGAAALLVILVV